MLSGLDILIGDHILASSLSTTPLKGPEIEMNYTHETVMLCLFRFSSYEVNIILKLRQYNKRYIQPKLIVRNKSTTKLSSFSPQVVHAINKHGLRSGSILNANLCICVSK